MKVIRAAVTCLAALLSCSNSSAQSEPVAGPLVTGEQAMSRLDHDAGRIVAVFVFSAVSDARVSGASVTPERDGAGVGFVGPFASAPSNVPSLASAVDALDLAEGEVAALVAEFPAPACDPIELTHSDVVFEVGAGGRTGSTVESVSESRVVGPDLDDEHTWIDALELRYCDDAPSTGGS